MDPFKEPRSSEYQGGSDPDQPMTCVVADVAGQDRCDACAGIVGNSPSCTSSTSAQAHLHSAVCWIISISAE